MLHFEPDTETFHDLCRHANAIPVYTSLLSDQLTPVSAFDRVAAEAQHAFLLESVVGGEKIARYSFLGANPIALIESRGDAVTTTTTAGTETHTTADPLKDLETLLAGFKAAHPPQLPRFLGGAVGYAGYDIVRLYENLPSPPQDDRDRVGPSTQAPIKRNWRMPPKPTASRLDARKTEEMARAGFSLWGCLDEFLEDLGCRLMSLFDEHALALGALFAQMALPFLRDCIGDMHRRSRFLTTLTNQAHRV